MTRKTETLHEGWGYFTIKKRYLKDGTQLVFEARLADNKAHAAKEKAKKLKKK